MEDNHIIKLMNPKVVKLRAILVTTRTTKRGTVKKLKTPHINLDVVIQVTEPLQPGWVYEDEKHQRWYAAPVGEDGEIQIRNVVAHVSEFRMPATLIVIVMTGLQKRYATNGITFIETIRKMGYSPAPEKVTFDEDWLALNDTL